MDEKYFKDRGTRPDIMKQVITNAQANLHVMNMIELDVPECFKSCTPSAIKPLAKEDKICLARCFDTRLESRTIVSDVIGKLREDEL